MSRLCIDLGSGLGGASAAFEDAGWDVVKIDIERKFRPTIQADYSCLPLRSDLRPDEVLAAPDCSSMSIASVYRHWAPGHPPTPKSERAKAACKTTVKMKDEIKRLRPVRAIVENPHPGMMCHILGKPDHKIRQSDYGSKFKKPTGLWEMGELRHDFPLLESIMPWIKAARGSKKGVQGVKGKHVMGSGGIGDYIRAPSLRAKWPYGLSEAIYRANITRGNV